VMQTSNNCTTIFWVLTQWWPMFRWKASPLSSPDGHRHENFNSHLIKRLIISFTHTKMFF
jgi:hypothetical protein